MLERLQAKYLLPSKNNKNGRSAPARKGKGIGRRKGRRDGQSGVQSSGGRNNAIALNYMPVFPSSVRRRLVYYDTGTLNVTSGALNMTVFSANGLYDPNVSGIGHQPTGFDQMMVFYDHYVVLRAKCTVNWFNTSSGASAQVALALNSSNSVVTDYVALSEGGYLVRDFLNSNATSDAIKTSRLSVSIPKFSGTPNIRDATDLWGTATSNPTEQTYFNLCVWDFQGGSPSVRYEIMLEYDAWFLEPRKLTSSLTQALHKLILVDEKKKTGATS